MESKNDDCTVYNIEAESELRFVVTHPFNNVSLKLLSGFAEIFGSELVKDEKYTFVSPAAVAVFTWQGCSVEFNGKARKMLVSKQPSMIIPTYMHACLEERRIYAEAENTRGPISLVVGSRDSGKSSFCRILLNYAARLGRRPLYVDLDVDQNSSSLPGTISILPVEKPCDVTEGFNHKALSVYSFGYRDPNENIPLYLLFIKEMGKKLRSRLKNATQDIRSSGVIIDSYGWEAGCGYTTCKLAASAFDVDVIFVIRDKHLYFWFERHAPPTVEVVFIPKQDGVLMRRRKFRSRIQESRIWDYFYGLRTPLVPHEFDVKFSEIEIYKITPVSPARNSPSVTTDDIDIVKVPFGDDLVYHIFSLSYSDVADRSHIIKTNVVGFVCITKVCLEKEVLTLLSPQPYPLPSKILIMGNVKLK